MLVGALWALAAYALGSFDRLPALRAAVLAALPFLLTGFLHLDGFMDCCDAILSRRDLPTRQKILKDSHVGSFAVVCTIFLMLAAFAAFLDFDAKEGWQGLASASGFFALCLELLRVRLPPDADQPVRLRL